MAPQKETIMVLKVDLDCPRCYKKVKKLLCQFPQIHDQVYNEKQNTVMIKVFCCSPEKIRDKLCCKGGKSIKSIEILHPKKPPPPPPPADKSPEKPADKPPPAPPPPSEKPKQEVPPPPPPEPAPNPAPPPEMKKNGSKKNGSPRPDPPPEAAPPQKPKDPEPAPEPKQEPPPQKPDEPAPVPVPVPVPQADPNQCYPVYQVRPVNMCCPECYQGRTTGPCYHGYGYGVPPPSPPPPTGGYGYYSDCCPPPPPPGGYGGGYNYNNYKSGYCVSRCGDYISDENPTACVIM